MGKHMTQRKRNGYGQMHGAMSRVSFLSKLKGDFFAYFPCRTVKHNMTQIIYTCYHVTHIIHRKFTVALPTTYFLNVRY